MIQLYDDAARQPRRDRVQLQLNSIGDRNCRPAVRRASCARGSSARRRARRGRAPEARDEPAAASSTMKEKPPRVQALLRDAPKIGESLCDECRAHFAAVRAAARRLRRPLRARPDARPRARLLHAHDLRVRRAGGERLRLDDLRRRPLRRARRGDRRAADARRSASAPGIERLLLAMERGAGATAERAGDGRLLRARRRRPRERRSRLIARPAPPRASPPTPTTPAARSRAS